MTSGSINDLFVNVHDKLSLLMANEQSKLSFNGSISKPSKFLMKRLMKFSVMVINCYINGLV